MNGRTISGYYQRSTGTTDEAEAWRWCREEEQRFIREYLLGPSEPKAVVPRLTFGEAVALFRPEDDIAEYLEPVVERWLQKRLEDIRHPMVNELACQLYPEGGVALWNERVVRPVRAVFDHAHAVGKCPAITVRSFRSMGSRIWPLPEA